MLKLSKPLSHQAIWFQELNHQWIRCSREDFSHILILIDTDLERTTIKFQSTAHTEQELIHTSEMVQPALTVTMVDNQTTSQIASMDQRKTHPRPGINSKYQERQEDIHFNIQILTSSNQELSGRKYSPRISVPALFKTWLDHSVQLPEGTSKKTCQHSSIRSIQITVPDSLKQLVSHSRMPRCEEADKNEIASKKVFKHLKIKWIN